MLSTKFMLGALLVGWMPQVAEITAMLTGYSALLLDAIFVSAGVTLLVRLRHRYQRNEKRSVFIHSPDNDTSEMQKDISQLEAGTSYTIRTWEDGGDPFEDRIEFFCRKR